MGCEVYANGMSIACKAADGKTIAAFPDVCFTPPLTPATPPGVPIPYPNTGLASDTAEGSKTVMISGKEVMLKNKSYFNTSSGDEAGNAPKKGVVTSKIKGKVNFCAWSMDVKFEGENVPRHLDLTGHNEASEPPNTPPWPYVDAMSAPDPPKKPCKSSCPREPSAEDYEKVRSKSPTPEIRKAVNSNTPKTCAACGLPAASLAADHIVSLKIISKMPGFACLSGDDQKAVANSPNNFVGLCRSCNSSKCAKTWHRWQGVKSRGLVFSPDVRAAARTQTNQQIKDLKAKVREMPCKE
jgi:5-methylcytosine-specific restriction endonuclease McrA